MGDGFTWIEAGMENEYGFVEELNLMQMTA